MFPELGILNHLSFVRGGREMDRSPPNILFAHREAQMDEYNVVANKTRNLEQEYIGRAFATHTEQVHALKRTIAELEEQGEYVGDDNSAAEGLRGQLQALEAENERAKDEIERLRKELREEVERLETQHGGRDSMPERIRILEEENRRLRTLLDGEEGGGKQHAGAKRAAEDVCVKDHGGGGALDVQAIASLSDKQDQILQSVRELGRLREDYRVRVDVLERMIENQRSNEERLEESIYKLKSMHGGEDAAALRQRIAALERENNQHVRDKYAYEKSEKLASEQKDTIVLLQDAVASKEKAIGRLTAQIERLKRNEEHGTGEDPADMIKPRRSVVNVQDAAEQEPSPHGGVDGAGRKAKKQTRPGAARPKTAPAKPDPSKFVSVENLIKEDNKSFFNNLSFTNSSPMPDKKAKK